MTMPSSQIEDKEQRAQALEAETSFIVQAPAGSGKTELLIQRYLRLLSLVDAPEEIIAITFTRKAAAEMKERIVSALYSPGEDEEGSDNQRTTRDLANLARDRGKELNWHLDENPTRIKVQTIDSLTSSLTKQMPILSKLGAQPETIEDAGELYRQAAENTIAELEGKEHWSESVAILLKHLDNNLPRVTSLLAIMLAKRDQWLRHVVQQHQREELENTLRHLVESELHPVGSAFSEQHAEELLSLLKYAGDSIVSEQANPALENFIKLSSLPSDSPDQLENWQAIADFLLTQSDDWRKTATVKLGFPPASASKTEAEKRKQMKKRYENFLSELSADAGLHKLLVTIRSLPPLNYTDREWQVVEALYNLLVLADAQLRLLFAENNQMDFSGIAQAAIQALGDAETPTELALRLDYRIRHILVDEFQDISVNQYVLLECLTNGWSEGDGHSLFLVGDPMQSIYRFREAEVGLFLSTWQQQRLNQLPLVPLKLRVNFRSGKNLVNWANHTFSTILPATSVPEKGAVGFTEAKAFHTDFPDNALHIHPCPLKDLRLEARQLIDIIRQCRETDKNGSIAVLARNRSHLSLIINELQSSDLPYQAVEIDNLAQVPVIQDLLALTLALTHPEDRISWLAILRAPWCGLSLKDLLYLTGDDRDSTVWQCILDTEKQNKLDDDARNRLLRFINQVRPALTNRGRLRLSRWIKSVWLTLGGPACLHSEADLSNCEKYFHLLNEQSGTAHLINRERFIGKVEKLYAASEQESMNAIQLMTIHKAKGLEFDTVILPGLSRGTGFDDASLLMWMELSHGEHQDLLLAPIREMGQEDSPIYSYLKRLDAEKQYYEYGRLLYVAATRAKKYLHLLVGVEQNKNEISLRKPRKNSLAAQLWPIIESECGENLDYNDHDSGEGLLKTPESVTYKRLTVDWCCPSPPRSSDFRSDTNTQADTELSPDYEWAGEIIKHVGVVVHDSIQQLADSTEGLWQESDIRALRQKHILKFRQLGVDDNDMELALQRVEKALGNIINDERGQWLFSNQHSSIRNEYALSGVYRDRIINVVLDRTFVDENGIRWIVDYKTSRHDGGDPGVFLDQQQDRYRTQLYRYAHLFSNMDDRNIRLGLYFPLLKGWREWEYKSNELSAF